MTLVAHAKRIGWTSLPSKTGYGEELHCSACGKEVNDADTYWCLDLHKETMEDGCVTVHQADMVAGFCSRECLLTSSLELPKWMLQAEGE